MSALIAETNGTPKAFVIRRSVDGILLFNKSHGISSNLALQKVRGLFRAKKAGHTGTLDPLATGLLIICFGEATKFSSYLLNSDKVYRATIKLGATTATGDSEGEILSTHKVDVTLHAVEKVLREFVGACDQLPPMYSAIKHKGKPLYTYARAGHNVERVARKITIYSIDLERYSDDEFTLLVHCSKGTYLRTLAEDIGSKLGCGAYLKELERLAIGAFKLENSFSLSQLDVMDVQQRDAVLMEKDYGVLNLPKISLDFLQSGRICNGLSVKLHDIETTSHLRIYDNEDLFLGVGIIDANGVLAPIRLVKTENYARWDYKLAELTKESNVSLEHDAHNIVK